MKCCTPAAFAASIRLRVPFRSTVSTVSSPPRRAEFAVVTTVAMPLQAASSEARSRRSPRAISHTPAA
jgi:hypothetical protein